MFQFRKAARKTFQILFGPFFPLHEKRIAFSFHFQQRTERIQPARIQTRRPQLSVICRKRIPEFCHILRIPCIIDRAAFFQNVQRGIAAERRRHIQYIGKHSALLRAVFFYIAVNQFLHNRRVNCITLPHEPETVNHIVRAVVNRNGINLRRSKFRRHLMKTCKSLLRSGQFIDSKAGSVRLLHQRYVFAYTRIVAGACKKGRYTINRLPEAVNLPVFQRRFGNQKRAPVQIFLFLRKMNPAIPHHSLKIMFQPDVARVISARLILRIILEISPDL